MNIRFIKSINWQKTHSKGVQLAKTVKQSKVNKAVRKEASQPLKKKS